tara:strand:+ start:1031 stop:1414 length:384 start_codon:yes stop_codon:yes gene_type:complete
MAHFAELDENNKVLQVLVVSNDITTVDGVENEQLGIDFLNDLLPDSGTWVQTSYNKNMRFNYAGTSYTYDASNDAFYAPQPYPSWALDENFRWQPPVAQPVVEPNEDGLIDTFYEWNEETQTWDEIE